MLEWLLKSCPSCCRVEYLEAHICDLTSGYVSTTLGHSDARDVVVVSDKKLLVMCLQILNDNIATDGVDHVHAIGMNLEAIGYFAFESDRCLQLQVFNRTHLSCNLSRTSLLSRWLLTFDVCEAERTTRHKM